MTKEYTVKVDADGTKRWYFNDLRHRTDGPAVEYANGTKLWYFNDLRHRTDGPAVEYANGTKRWYIEGNELTKREFNKRVAKLKPCTEKIIEVDGVKYRLVPL